MFRGPLFQTTLALMLVALAGILTGLWGSAITPPPASGPFPAAVAALPTLTPLPTFTPTPPPPTPTPLPPPTATPIANVAGRRAIVTGTGADSLLIRTAPSLNAATISSVQDGTEVLVEEATENEGILWYKVTWLRITGWSRAAYLRLL